jgi:hypothetical protein
VSWLEELGVQRSGVPPERPIRVRDYEMPEHPVTDGAGFAIEDERAFGELARWFANGNLMLRHLAPLVTNSHE